MRKKVVLVLIVVIAMVNIGFNMYNSNDLLDLASLRIEALAGAEGGDAGEKGPLFTNWCPIKLNVIIGRNFDGSPVVKEVWYDGEEGKCQGSSGSCTSYSCVKSYI